jgi:hypothetical protein
MGRIYTAVFNGTITAAGGDSDLISIQPADDKPIKLRGFRLSQTSEVGDAQEEGARITVKRLPATLSIGSGGAAVTPTPMDSANVACGATVRCNDTSVATSTGNVVVLEEIGWNVRNSPCDFWYPDADYAPKVKQGEGLIVRLETTLADDITACLTFWLEEE